MKGKTSEWDEYLKTNKPPKVGDSIRCFDPDTHQIRKATVTRIASNGIRADQEGYGIVALRAEKGGIWY